MRKRGCNRPRGGADLDGVGDGAAVEEEVEAVRGARGGDDGRDAGDRRRVAAVRPAVHVDARARGARVDDDAVVAADPVRREHDRKHDRGHDREQDSRRDNRRNDDVPARRTASRLLVGVHRRVLALLRKQRGLHVAVCHPSSNKKTHEKVVQSKRKGEKKIRKRGRLPLSVRAHQAASSPPRSVPSRPQPKSSRVAAVRAAAVQEGRDTS